MICCPNCGSDLYESNRIDEAPFLLAAQDAPQLRHFGQMDAAVLLISTLGLVRLKNFLRPEWICVSCGAQFDD
jgi:hypothetical protein